VPRVAVVGSYGVGLTFGSAPERGGRGQVALPRPRRQGVNQRWGGRPDRVTFLTAVGEDAFGDRAFELWGRRRRCGAVLRAAPTMTAAILVERQETGS
jgi:hypothetical protein